MREERREGRRERGEEGGGGGEGGREFEVHISSSKVTALKMTIQEGRQG